MQQSSPVASEASILANAIATILCEHLSVQDQNILGNLLSLVATSMLSIAAINQSILEAQSSLEKTDAAKAGSDPA
ncbi:hypothetical protein [Ethanoligenens harbinense]|uniref:Uncharacterized protein n=1 Tax=Ethanoligenens harbinense (strain DSM 18485 / JCM 12961 / CGMCC 1.5033 / YUAN-3) TaxID=663278 RepID=E6U464_ETHHY|nr:hypothetical protein [Ethanoligenens harbinense]ADU26564.1 hypothetical protein Ethha_1011 [Ethanoligenens harbinense YUAN-3]AVQ95690.1 hypothetical protein CXQ68_05240 [Ethanoligenens harbinense YUAN-3]AYF38353.1 hypothetical protein CXP51_05100 [Ethanoligenens harbinense]AYF41098.1 hypothetical protein CN246_05230 [Ethanoligenens harbinense]QCN91929.1 hypothetical protein DRA42_05255 [Ethanoligenens harbinense]